MYNLTHPINDRVFTWAFEVVSGFENLSLRAYPDPLSKAEPYTIGYGTTIYEDGVLVRPSDKISKEYAEQLVYVEIIKGWVELQKIPDFNLDKPCQQVALLSFGFNLGYGFYKHPHFSTITNALQKGTDREIAETLLLYRNPNTNVELGLARRRLSEGLLYLGITKDTSDLSLEDVLSYYQNH